MLPPQAGAGEAVNGFTESAAAVRRPPRAAGPAPAHLPSIIGASRRRC